MIKNRSLLVLMLMTLVGCGSARAVRPEPLQGVVEHDETVLAFEVGGRVLALPAARGASIAVGAEVGRLDDGLERPLRDARAAEVRALEAQLRLLQAGPRGEEVRATRAELEATRAQLAIVERARARQTRLEGVGASAEANGDSLDSQQAALAGRTRGLEQQLLALRHGSRAEELDAMEARLAAGTASLAATDARLARYALASPIAGVVVEHHTRIGEVVGPGTPAVTVADLDHPYVDVFVPEGRMRELRIGLPIRVRVDGVDQPLAGRVEYVGNRTEFTPRFLFSDGERPNLVLRVRVRIDDPRHQLHAGVPAFVTLGGQR